MTDRADAVRPGDRHSPAMLAMAGLLMTCALAGCNHVATSTRSAPVMSQPSPARDGVAIVGDEVIDRATFDRLWQLSRRRPPFATDSAAQRAPQETEVLVELVKERLLAQEAARRGLSVEPGESPRDALAADLARPWSPTADEQRRFFEEHLQLYGRKAQVRFLHYRAPSADVRLPSDLPTPQLLALCDQASAADPTGRRWGDMGWLQAGHASWWRLPTWTPELVGSTRDLVDDHGRRHLLRAMHYRPAARYELEQVAEDCRQRLTAEHVQAEVRRLLAGLARTTPIQLLDQRFPARLDPEAIARSEPGLSLTALRAGGTAQEEPPDMLLIPGGSFTTGSTDAEIDERVRICKRYVEPALGEGSCAREKFEDEIRREVTLAGFWIDRTEVTWDAYQELVEATRHRPLPLQESGQPGYPVANVSQEDAEAYCRWLGKRLPSADEWEYAARGSEGRRYPWGNQPPDGTRANFCDVRCTMPWRNPDHDDGSQGPAPVGSYPAGATPEGVLDMAGNVREWTGTREGELAYVKGGGFENAIDDLIAADVRLNHVETRDPAIGFRCARSAGAQAASTGR